MRNQLDKIFKPESIAVIGASDKPATVGFALMNNLLNAGFSGTIYPVNPGHPFIHGLKSYPTVNEIPKAPDLAVIATPAKVVPKVVLQCGKAGVGGIVIISAGFKEVGEKGEAMLEEIVKTARKYGMRMIGPNCLGIIHPALNLNASFASRMALPGKMAFISQSGALCTSILDWSVDQRVGFSHFVSIGSMVDVGFHDLIDYFATDPKTSCILIYMESLTNARAFMSAARAFARYKPIIVLKAGKSAAGAKAALSHTGTLAGNDRVYSAAFRRAGIMEVETIQQLFDFAQAIAMQPRPEGNRLAIVTNAGGPGVLATDYLTENGGKLAILSEKTFSELDGILPAAWSHSNPVDVLGDANALQFKQTVHLMDMDTNVDAILCILTTQAVTKPAEVARALVELKVGKPILACWMGEADVWEAREILEEGSIPNYRYPESAVAVFLKMYQYDNNLKLLYETPPNIPEQLRPDKQAAKHLLRSILNEGRFQLREDEAKKLLTYYQIPIPKGDVLSSAQEAAAFAEKIGFPVVLKIASPEIGHKTDFGGVRLGLDSGEAVRKAFNEMLREIQEKMPHAKLDGIRVEKMVHEPFELLIGAKKDPVFGPVIVFGSGGVAVEVYQDTNLGLPPLNMVLAKHIISKTRISRIISGFRGMPAVDMEALQFLLVKFSYLLMDFPEILDIDINPYAIGSKGGTALDAHIILDEKQPDAESPYGHLVISPYPTQYIREITMKNGQKAILRPIRPEDEPLEAEMFSHLSRQSLYFRFFSYFSDVSHKTLIRFTQIDYDREMAIIAELDESGTKKMAGVVRIICDSLTNRAEYAIVVADPWQGQGLGSALTDFIIEIATERQIWEIYAEVLTSNEKMLKMLRNRQFQIQKTDSGMHYLTLNLNVLQY